MFVQYGFDSGLFKNRDDYVKRREDYGKLRPVSIVVAGDSLVRMVNTRDIADHSGLEERGVQRVSFGGATPRTLRWFFEKTGYQSVVPGGTCAIFLSPMQLSVHNRLFERTLDAAFDLRMVFSELLPRGRWKNIRYYILNDLLPLQRYKNQLKDNLKSALGRENVPLQKGLDPSAASATPATPEQMKRWLDIFARESIGPVFELDDYQTDSLQEIIARLRKQSIRVVLVVPPASPGALAIIGDKGVKDFLGYLKNLQQEAGVDLLDYLKENKGYEFQDAVHLILSSRERFSKKLAEDLSRTLASTPS